MELFRLTPEHLLLPALLRSLLVLLLLLGQFLLPARKLFQLLERLVDLLRTALGRRLLAGLVLVLLHIQFEIEKILDGIPDPTGQVYRFSLAGSLMKANRSAWTKETR